MVEFHNNNFENTTNQTESSENSDFLESIKQEIQSLPKELQELGLKELEDFNNHGNEKTLKNNIESIKIIESMKGIKDGYNEFIKLLKNNNSLHELYELITIDQESINDYIIDNGFPINQETLSAFNSEFGLNIETKKIESEKQNKIAQEQEEIAQEQEEIAQEQEEIAKTEKKKLILLGSELSIYSDRFKEIKVGGENFLSLVKELDGNTSIERENEIKSKLNELLNNQENLNQILTILQEIDKEKGIDSSSPDSVYSKFTSKLIEYNPSFESKIRAFENQKLPKNIQQTSSETARIYAGLGTENPDKKGNFLSNGDVMVNISKKPPERFIGDENYKVETSLPIGDFYPAILKFERAKQKLEPKIDSLNLLLKNTEYLEDLLNSNLDINQIKTNLKNTLGLELDFINSKEDLDLSNLERLKNTFSTELEKAELEFKKELRSIMNSYHKKLEQKDKMTRETLNFLKSIGFDQIPQSITDNMINQLNLNTALRTKLGFTTEIDIKNGLLGTDSDANISSITSKEKADFARAFNIMIYGDENLPINLDSVLNDRGSPISDMASFSAELDRAGLKDPGKANLIIMNNIREFGKEEGKPQ